MIEKTVFALGFFDGVHLGHQALLQEARRLAKKQGCKAGAVTFDLPPACVLHGAAPNMINTLRDRKVLLSHYAMDEIRVLETTGETLATAWDSFLEGLIAEGAAGFVCGSDFRFGAKGAGNATLLAEFAAGKGLPCSIIPEQQLDGQRISSTAIRALLEKGDMEQANRLLGHAHCLSGIVESGKQLGRTMGIPTANLALPDELLKPAFGVYACLAWVDGKRFLAVTNVGSRPTVHGQGITVESWLLDFGGDLYGKELKLEFFKFLRPEKKFDSLGDLQAEIRKNSEETRKFFGSF